MSERPACICRRIARHCPSLENYRHDATSRQQAPEAGFLTRDGCGRLCAPGRRDATGWRSAERDRAVGLWAHAFQGGVGRSCTCIHTCMVGRSCTCAQGRAGLPHCTPSCKIWLSFSCQAAGCKQAGRCLSRAYCGGAKRTRPHGVVDSRRLCRQLLPLLRLGVTRRIQNYPFAACSACPDGWTQALCSCTECRTGLILVTAGTRSPPLWQVTAGVCEAWHAPRPAWQQ